MAQGYSDYLVGVSDGSVNPPKKFDGRKINAKVRVFSAKFDMANTTVKKVNGDTNVCFTLPRGYKFLYGIINASVTMGETATIAIGKSGTPAKYRAAAVFTDAAPTLFGVSTAVDDDPLDADEEVIFTIGAEDLPGAGILTIDFYCSGR